MPARLHVGGRRRHRPASPSRGPGRPKAASTIIAVRTLDRSLERLAVLHVHPAQFRKAALNETTQDHAAYPRSLLRPGSTTSMEERPSVVYRASLVAPRRDAERSSFVKLESAPAGKRIMGGVPWTFLPNGERREPTALTSRSGCFLRGQSPHCAPTPAELGCRRNKPQPARVRCRNCP